MKDLDRLIEELEREYGYNPPRITGDTEWLRQAVTTLRSMGEEIERLREESATVSDKRGALFREIRSLKETATKLREQLGEARADRSKLIDQVSEADRLTTGIEHRAEQAEQTCDRLKAALETVHAELTKWQTTYAKAGSAPMACVTAGQHLRAASWACSKALTPQEVCEECGGSGVVVSLQRKYKKPCPSCQPQTPGDVVMGEGEE